MDKNKTFLNPRHKGSFITPGFLDEIEIPYAIYCQNAGEFVIQALFAYHAGWNKGGNITESINYGTEKWIDYGLYSKDWYKLT